MQKGFILRGGCSDTGFQSTHHYCSTHEAIRIINNTTLYEEHWKCMHTTVNIQCTFMPKTLATLSSIHMVQGFLDQETVLQ